MTNEEKFRAGTVVYKDDDGDYVCELWEASTRHPDVVYHMNADGKYKKSGLRSSFLLLWVGATAGPGMFLTADNGRGRLRARRPGLPNFSIYGNFFHQFHHLPVNPLFPKTNIIWHPELCKVGRAGHGSPHMRRRGLGSS